MKIKNDNEYELLLEAYNSVKDKIPYKVEVGIILGSGLGDLINKIDVGAIISYEEIKNFPIATNKAHKGKFIFSKINGKNTVIAQGRIHYYEGYDVTTAVRTVRLMKMFGINTLYVTNAAGGINSSINVGDIMVITNHISFFMPNPLNGKNLGEFGVRFPDMSEPYDREIQEKIVDAAKKKGINIVKGVYVQVQGPSYETRAEINALKILGADAVGMSTVIEVIAAKHAGIKVAGLSMITNLTALLTNKKQSDDDVKEMATKYANNIMTLLFEVI